MRCNMLPENSTTPLDSSFADLFAHSPVPMWIYDQQTLCFLQVNQSAVQHYGYSRDQFLSMTLMDIRTEAELERLQTSVRATPLQPDRAGTWPHIKANGETLWAEITLHNIAFRGRAAVLAVAVDVTGRVQAQAEANSLFTFSADMLAITSMDGALLRYQSGRHANPGV